MYTFDSRVRYSETGEDGLLSLPAIVDYFQDASTFQSEDLGIGIDFLKEKDLLWVMSAWQVVVHRYPALGEKIRIGTIEKYEKRIPIAKQNFKTAGREDKITLLEGDAAEILAELSQPFDFIFMDAAKGQYMHFLPDVLRLLAPGGLLVSDNVLQEGNIIESRYAVCRRDRTIHARMREYLYTLTHHGELETVVLPVGDGATLSVKLPEKEQNAQP